MEEKNDFMYIVVDDRDGASTYDNYKDLEEHVRYLIEEDKEDIDDICVYKGKKLNLEMNITISEG